MARKKSNPMTAAATKTKMHAFLIRNLHNDRKVGHFSRSRPYESGTRIGPAAEAAPRSSSICYCLEPSNISKMGVILTGGEKAPPYDESHTVVICITQ